MKLNELFKKWEGTITISKQLMLSNIVLSMIILGLVVKLNSEHERVVLMPPTINEAATVAWRSASGNYMESWGLFIASMIGSVTPQTALSVADSMGLYFDASIYPSIRNQILSIVDDPNYTRSGTINVFTPKVVQWEPATEKIFVQGTLATTAYKNTSQPIGQFNVTYEMVIKVVAGVPKIMRFTSYTGQARTVKWKESHKAQLEAEEKKASKQQDTILPQDSDIRNALEEAAKKASEKGPEQGADGATSAKPAEPAAKEAPAPSKPTQKEQL